MTPLARLRAMLQAGAFPLALVAIVFVSSPLHLPLNNPNEGVRVFAAKALVEHGTFAIDDVVRAWGYIDDKATHDGKLYSSKAPLASLVGAAGYFVVRPFTGDLERPALTRVCRGALALVCLPPLFVVRWGLRRRLRDLVVADLVTAGVLFAVLPLLNVFAGHALAALAPAAALLLIAHGTRAALAAAGALLAAAVGAEYPALLACAPLAMLAVVAAPEPHARGVGSRARAAAWLALGALPLVVVISAAHTAMFGAPWRTGYGALENAAYQKVVEGSLFGVGAPHADVLGMVTLSPSVGLFWFAPFLLVGAVWIVVMVRAPASRAQGIALAVAALLMLAFIAGFRGWRGGWSVGPRYISELIGVLAVPAALAFDALAHRALARAALAALVAVTLLHSAIAGAFFPHLPDLFANPVHELMLPLLARGLAPDSLPLLLGFPPPVAAALIVVVLALPLVLQGGRTAGAGALAVAVVVVVAPVVHTEPRAKAALEGRRMLDNWRPESGNPLIDDADEREDPRRLVAVDRARVAWPLARARGCPGPLVVVPDTLALSLSLSSVIAEPVLMVTASDLARAKGPLPCAGDVAVLGEVPPSLARFPVVRREGALTWLARP